MAVRDTFTKLVRYADGTRICYGELVDIRNEKYRVHRLEGNLTEGFSHTDETHEVTSLLCPLPSVPIFQCIGLNYQDHVKEAKLSVPSHPVVFTKPSDALSGPFDDVCVPVDAQDKLDWEGELCVVIGKDAKNVSEDDALSYVLGYTIGNDVSARNFQLPETSGGQFCYAKSFDGFAPIGPAIWSVGVVPDPQKLKYQTLVNGIVVQDTGTADMIWSVRQIITHLARGTTLRAGTVIMTGTPAGVGYSRNWFLKDGDVVTVRLEGLGEIANAFRYEK